MLPPFPLYSVPLRLRASPPEASIELPAEIVVEAPTMLTEPPLTLNGNVPAGVPPISSKVSPVVSIDAPELTMTFPIAGL
jgi:hypothetical protein